MIYTPTLFSCDRSVGAVGSRGERSFTLTDNYSMKQ